MVLCTLGGSGGYSDSGRGGEIKGKVTDYRDIL